MKKQNIFKYHFNLLDNDDDFFVNTTNSNAYNKLIKFDSRQSFLSGPSKSGKSFLGQIWLKKNNAIKLSNNFENILNQKKNLLIDNLSLFDQEQIFHLINHSFLNNSKILIISNKNINDINFKYEDLSSRLKTFEYFVINSPNDEMLLTILTKLLMDKQFVINSKEIFDYILKRVDRSYSGIHDIVHKLDVLSLEKKRQLTIPLIKEIL